MLQIFQSLLQDPRAPLTDRSAGEWSWTRDAACGEDLEYNFQTNYFQLLLRLIAVVDDYVTTVKNRTT